MGYAAGMAWSSLGDNLLNIGKLLYQKQLNDQERLRQDALLFYQTGSPRTTAFSWISFNNASFSACSSMALRLL